MLALGRIAPNTRTIPNISPIMLDLSNIPVHSLDNHGTQYYVGYTIGGFRVLCVFIDPLMGDYKSEVKNLFYALGFGERAHLRAGGDLDLS